MREPRDPPPAAEMIAQERAMRALARSILDSAADADDVVQAAYLAAIERAEPARAPWLAGVVRNLARRCLRDRTRRRRHEERAARPESGSATDDVVERVELHRTLVETVLGLPRPYRDVVVLRYWHDLPPRAIAERTAQPVATVKTQLQRGLAMMRERLDRAHRSRREWMLALVPLARPGKVATLAVGGGVATAMTLLPWIWTMKTVWTLGLCAAACLASLAFWPDPARDSDDLTSGRPTPPGVVATVESDAMGGGRPTATSPLSISDQTAARHRADVADQPGCRVIARIIDDKTGAPVAGAVLRFEQERYPDAQTELSATADTGGEIRMSIPRSAFVRGIVPANLVVVSSLAHAMFETRLERQIRTGVDVDLGTLRLYRGAEIHGVVRDPDGHPIRSTARLELWSSRLDLADGGLLRGRDVGSTELGGSFRLSQRVGPAGDHWWLAALSEEGVGAAPIRVVAGQEEHPPVDLRLLPNGGLRVRVTDRDGVPQAGVELHAMPHFLPLGRAPVQRVRDEWLHVQSREYRRVFLRTTDATGEAIFERLPLPVGTLIADANDKRGTPRGYIVHSSRDDVGRRSFAGARPSREGLALFEVTIGTESGVSIYGRVVDPSGAPIEGIRVRAHGVEVRATTDAAGLYRLDPYPFRGRANLVVEGEGHAPQTHAVAVVAGEDAVRHDVVVEPVDPVRGVVVDDSGRPIEGVRVYLGPAGKAHSSATPPVTGEDGEFTFPTAPRSHDDLWVEPPAPAVQWKPPIVDLDVRQDARVVLRRVRAPLVSLHARVLDAASGSPCGGLEARLVSLRGSIAAARLPLDLELGSVRCDAVAPGRHRLTVDAPGDRRAEVEFEVDGSGNPIDLDVFVEATGTVVCTLDTTSLGTELSERLLIGLQPSRERSYAVDRDGERLPLTPNCGLLGPGEPASIRLLRVTSGVPRRLHVLSADLFAEAWFVAAAGVETHVTLQPEPAGTVAFRSRGTLDGIVEIEFEVDGVWRTLGWGAEDRPYDIRRPAGLAAWRLSYSPRAADTPIELRGSVNVVAGAIVEVVWAP